MTTETSDAVAALAGRIMAGHEPTRDEILSLAGSALVQHEPDGGEQLAFGGLVVDLLKMRDDAQPGAAVLGGMVGEAAITFTRAADGVLYRLAIDVAPEREAE